MNPSIKQRLSLCPACLYQPSKYCSICHGAKWFSGMVDCQKDNDSELRQVPCPACAFEPSQLCLICQGKGYFLSRVYH